MSIVARVEEPGDAGNVRHARSRYVHADTTTDRRSGRLRPLPTGRRAVDGAAVPVLDELVDGERLEGENAYALDSPSD